MIRAAAIFGLLATLAAGEAAQPLLVPMPELLRRLDPQREWLLMPLADWQALQARVGAPRPAAPPAAGLAAARVAIHVEARGAVRAEAELVFENPGPDAALVELFSVPPARLGAVLIAGEPAPLAAGGSVAVLVPGGGRQVGRVAWSADLAGDPPTVNLPLPRAAAMALRASLAGGGELHAPGLVPDGAGWALTGMAPDALALAWAPGGAGSAASVWAAEHRLAVAIGSGLRPATWSVRLDARRGQPPASVDAELPDGFTAVRALRGVVGFAGGSGTVSLTFASGAREAEIEGFFSADAPVRAPRLHGAAWQRCEVALRGDAPVAADLPSGWRRLDDADGAMRFAAEAPGDGLILRRLPPDAGLTVAARTAVAVGAGRAVRSEHLRIQAGGERLFRLRLRLPEGWRSTALSGGVSVPPPEDLPTGELTIDLPTGLPPGETLDLYWSAVTDGADLTLIEPVTVAGTTRRGSRLLIAAAPGIDLEMSAAGWRHADAVGAPEGTRSELVADGEAEPVRLAVRPRQPALEADAVAWIVPDAAGAWCRLDLRLAVRDGEVDAVVIDAPFAAPGPRLAGEDLRVLGTGPWTVQAPAPWRGVRLVRLEGRLRPGAALAAPGLSLPAAGRAPLVRHWLALQAPPDGDLAAQPAAGLAPIDADELPAWAAPVPGATVVGAWRGTGSLAWSAVERGLAPVPPGFIDDLRLDARCTGEAALVRVACRIAAPGMADLDLGLPTGASLEAATVDGRPALLRRDGDAVRLALPGRTLVDVVLRYRQGAIVGSLQRPRLGDLPVVRSVWRLAIDPRWAAEAPGFALVDGAPPQRGWLGGWHPGRAVQAREAAAPVRPESAEPADPRRLVAPAPPPAADATPGIDLDGWLLERIQVGAPSAVALRLDAVSGLQAGDALGRCLAGLAVLAAALAGPLLLRALTALACAAVPIAVALLLAGGGGPLVALCEWLPVAVLLGWIAGRLLRRPACV